MAGQDPPFLLLGGNMHGEVSALYIVIPLLVFMPIFFIGLLGLISFILSSGGWRRLARQFAARPGINGETHYRVVGFIGSSSYKGAIKVIRTGSGLQIEASPALYVGHKPLFIPFGAFRNPQKKLMFHGRDYALFDVGEPTPVSVALPAAIFKGTPLEVR
jgi:hypothetical protein